MQKNDLFDYGLDIYQNEEYFKFSIDSILLAEFVKIKKESCILDLCTGNAPVPLILSKKYPNNKIDCIELQKEIYELGFKSIKENNLCKNIKIYNKNVRDFFSSKKYDIITCNPPYFKVTETSIKNENIIKRIARHEVELSLEDLIISVNNNIKSNGEFYLVHRCDRIYEILSLLEKYKFGVKKICLIYTKGNSPAKLFLLHSVKNQKINIKFYSKNISSFKTYKGMFEEV